MKFKIEGYVLTRRTKQANSSGWGITNALTHNKSNKRLTAKNLVDHVIRISPTRDYGFYKREV